MGFIEITITAVLIWVIVFGILKLFSLRENSWVVTLMDYYGLSISLGYLNWYTTSFNSMFIYLGSKHPRFFQLWFSAGIAAGFTCSLIGLGVLIYTILSKLFQPEEPPLLTPVLPGVNVPSNQLLYYFTSLLIAGVFHEMGHAIAAVRERIRVKGFGVFMLLMYPGAYVDFRDEFDSLTTIQQLRIYCAGVWHNVVLTAIAIGIISSMNTIMFPFYKPTEGVMITDISMGSPLRGSLYEGDLITAIGDCPVYDRLSWRNCIEYLMSDQYALRGFCVSKTQIQNAEKNNQFGCCNNPETANPSLQCFERQVNEKPQNICLTAREVVNERGFCFIDKDCEPYKTTEPKYCVKVSQTTPYANELIKISLKGSTPSVIFVGHPSLLFYELQVSDFSPRQFFAFLSPTFPLIIEELCEYIASISAALALLNMVPVFYLDGQWAWLGFVKLLFPHVTEENREKWCKYINIGSSALLILALLISLTAVL